MQTLPPLQNAVEVREVDVYTGSTTGGSLDSGGNCAGWTDNDGDNSSGLGIIEMLDGFYLSGVGASCAGQYGLYCITYTPLAPAPVRGSASPLKSWE